MAWSQQKQWGQPMSEHERVILEGHAAEVKRESARRTRRSFVVGGVAAAAGYGVLHWVNNSAPVGRVQGVLRRTLETDAAIDQTVFDYRGLSPTYPLSRAVPLRLNGVVGLGQTLPTANWRLQLAGVANAQRSPLYAKDVTAWQYNYAGDVKPDQQMEDVKDAPKSDQKLKPGDPQPAPVDGPAKPAVQPQTGTPSGGQASALDPSGAVDTPAETALAERFNEMARQITHKRVQGNAEAGASYSALDIGTPGLLLSMDDLLKLPKVELVTQFKCIEGWSVITQWAGVRLRDLIEAYPPSQIVENGRSRDPHYVYMETPDGDYYCGFDMAAARHPQSLLVTEMSGQPLAQEHGAPLRLHMPIKYGYKQIKRIGLIAYTDRKPDDFWTKLGYDWYAGL
jgi:hypothetical protein